MKEQVKEWIADKNLTTDSFDGIMFGVIYNSYHNTLDDPDVREWIGMHPSEFREMLPPNLNDNQQVVLEWLKENKMDNLFLTTARLHRGFLSGGVTSQVKAACGSLGLQQQAQVLQVFGKWAEEQEEE